MKGMKMKRSKRYEQLVSKYDKGSTYPLRDAIAKVLDFANANFDETVELSVELGVDPRKSDQMVRGSVTLPSGSGRERKVLVLAEGEIQEEAEEAGADWVGSDEYIEKVEEGWIDFDAVIATPEMMPRVAKLGRILGPRGMMPTPKNGTVTREIEQAVREIKKGKISFKVDKGGNLQLPVGKASFEAEDIFQNIREIIRKVWGLRPPSASGSYLKGLTVSSTMGPGVKVDVQQVRKDIIQGD